MSFLQIVWVFWHTLFRFSRAVARVWIVEALWVSDFAIHVSVSCNFLKTIDMYNRTTPFPWPVCCVIARQESKLDLTLEVERVPLLFFIPRRHNRQNLTVKKSFLFILTHTQHAGNRRNNDGLILTPSVTSPQPAMAVVARVARPARGTPPPWWPLGRRYWNYPALRNQSPAKTVELTVRNRLLYFF